ncbi:MAG: hypothetical protein GY807_21160 [Gammaproteobacteria bacterium]|nr:hypothetical protein [Gammaproteobacteria bacterium]
MKRDYDGMLLFFVNDKLSVIFEGQEMRSYLVPGAGLQAKVSCVMRRSDTLLAIDMVEFLRGMKVNEPIQSGF